MAAAKLKIIEVTRVKSVGEPEADVFLPSGKFAKSLIRMAGRLSKTTQNSESPVPLKREFNPQETKIPNIDIKKEPAPDSGMIKALLHSTEAKMSHHAPDSRIPRKREAEAPIDSEPMAKIFNPNPNNLPNNAGSSSPDSGWNSGDFSDSSIASPPGIYYFFFIFTLQILSY